MPRWSYTKINFFFVFQQSEDFFTLNCCIVLTISKNATLLNVVAMATKILELKQGKLGTIQNIITKKVIVI